MIRTKDFFLLVILLVLILAGVGFVLPRVQDTTEREVTTMKDSVIFALPRELYEINTSGDAKGDSFNRSLFIEKIREEYNRQSVSESNLVPIAESQVVVEASYASGTTTTVSTTTSY